MSDDDRRAAASLSSGRPSAGQSSAGQSSASQSSASQSPASQSSAGGQSAGRTALDGAPPGTTFAQLYPCDRCPLNSRPNFKSHEPATLRFLKEFKRGELQVGANANFLVEGTSSPHLYTVLSGWGYRYKTLGDGRRQVLNYIMPGDFVGLQSSVLGKMDHGVQALSRMLLCVFERNEFSRLFGASSELSYDIVWIASREEQMMEEHLLSIGRRTALERSAYLLAFLHDRGRRTGLLEQGAPLTPITQTHVADTLGMSLVHTNKTLRKLQEQRLIRWSGKSCHVQDPAALRNTAGWQGLPEDDRAFI